MLPFFFSDVKDKISDWIDIDLISGNLCIKIINFLKGPLRIFLLNFKSKLFSKVYHMYRNCPYLK